MDQRHAVSQMLFSAFARSKELHSRILFLLVALVIYRVGSHIPLPGVDIVVLESYKETLRSGLLGMFNTFSGGAFERMSIFVFSVFPYISASIIMMLMQFTVPYLSELAKEGTKGRMKIEQYTKYLAVVISFTQGLSAAFVLQKQTVNVGGEAMNLIMDQSAIFPFYAALIITASTMFLMWLGERITSKGLYNGLSILIFAGIVADMPASFVQTFEMHKVGSISGFVLIALFAWIIVMFGISCFVESSERRLALKNPRAISQAKQGNVDFTNETYVPFKVNAAGVMPVILAAPVMMFINYALKLLPESEFVVNLSTFLAWGSPAYLVMYALLIVVFAFVFVSFSFNSEQQAEGLRKQGTFIPGIRPGKPTQVYFDYLLTRLTFIGAIYLASLCVIPEIVKMATGVATSFSGTSVLIVVGVVIGLFDDVKKYLKEQVQADLMTKHKLKKGPRRKVRR
ncbi:MAG: preprotein translocase subunit SecY [Proteobacteria bacterium]|nr:preprotein translocase subunit SecY [Pseudomonadota bacterium]